jgi:hypothetical protein
MTASTTTLQLRADARDPPFDYRLILTLATIVVWTTLVNLPFFHAGPRKQEVFVRSA